MPERKTILIIDDEVSLCDLLATMLYTRNMNPVSANSLKQAAQILSEKKPFLVFLDNHLPDGLGIDFLVRIKSQYPDVQVVMITGEANEELQQAAIKEGCMGFLEKPFSYLKVSELLEQAARTKVRS